MRELKMLTYFNMWCYTAACHRIRLANAVKLLFYLYPSDKMFQLAK